MSFAKTNLQDWEKLVAKQLKTEDIYKVLEKENIEGLEIKPFYTLENIVPVKLPRLEENMHLVAPYNDYLLEDAYAFLIKEEPLQLQDKAFFYEDATLNTAAAKDKNNNYFCLQDIFKRIEHGETFNPETGKELLNTEAKRKIGVDISIYQNAGASIVQQLAIALLKIKELTELYGEEVFEQVIFRVAVGSQYFLEIAKIRALKILISQLSKEYSKEAIPYIFAETSLRNKSLNDPENNLIRSTLELASAMIGGADAVYANDYKLSETSSVSEEISFKQQIVLAYESIINVFEDATAGSFFVEDATKDIAERAWELFLELEKNGGYISNLESGKIQKLVYDQAIKEQNWLDEGKIKLLGVNLYPALEAKIATEELYTESAIKPVRLAERYGV
ncbi:methylmalonyl-CoA mutase family protein [Elizabethkingia sp. HX WHF]|uniref:methylmalonyl-CoA mutase family protein n=1 Tax=Elizabethkingia TaxID=308865 RepID=UPI00099A7302|nr:MULTISPECIES: methylmalonyl-CoA mutase family protein [Elizabethkingia]ATL42823.1 methylmalonyl-CoA mutase [Elizabethkingia miricola]MCL1637388.1 methylmalonyl-CoA mutase family protein [Elizabethkingia bruuniana]MDX8563309.1 methylmalonyl-CoA mutase family protein [Elizabethkingia sp. HX WHF]OPC19851.1 methylmalonyl-CoA mutase [Elizabethkingia bruuniana]